LPGVTDDPTPFSVRIPVRTYELDSLGHLNQAVYHSYAEVARAEAFSAAGCSLPSLVASGVGPVLLASSIRFRSEIGPDERVDVTAEVAFGAGKTFQMGSRLLKPDGTLAAEVDCTVGLMDLAARKLLADPREVLTRAGCELGRLVPAEASAAQSS
jgi:acyl-CoA thioester hydrolase